MEFFKNLFQKRKQNNASDPNDPNQTEEAESLEEVTIGTKIKVVAALLVVVFAGYIAYWIQQPVDVRSDLFTADSSNSSSMQSDSQMQDVAQNDNQPIQDGSDTQGQDSLLMDGVSPTDGQAQNNTEMETSGTQQVSISNSTFNPATITVALGTTVTWTNNDTAPHNVDGNSFVSPTLNPGDSYSYTFGNNGSFSYKSSLDPQMDGTVIVGNGIDTQEVVPAPAVLPAPPVPETINTSSTPAPGAAPGLHNAALQPLSSSLSNVANIAGNSGMNAQTQISVPVAVHPQPKVAAQNPMSIRYKGKLASSGPDDYVYFGMFGLTLFMNRKKLGLYKKSKKSKK